MGGATSRFDETDWDQDPVDGGVSQTIDGATPTRKHTVLTLTKRTPIHLRAYEVRDEQTNVLLYTTKPVKGTMKWFDVYAGKDNEENDGNNEAQKVLLRVNMTDIKRRKWDVYSYQPNWDGQIPSDKARTKLEQIMHDKKDAAQQLNVYWKAQFTIALDHADVQLYQRTRGILSNVMSPSLLRVEPIQSLSAQYQSFVPKPDEKKPPLTGFWQWENTAETHKIKMDLAKGTDVALHCILAIVANMVRLDSNRVVIKEDVIEGSHDEVKQQRERIIVVGMWKDRNEAEALIEPSDEACATEMEKSGAENSICVTMGPDPECRLLITHSKHRRPIESVTTALAKMVITVGFIGLYGIVATATAVEEIVAALKERRETDDTEEDLAFLLDYMEPGYSAIISAYSEEIDPELVVMELKALGAEWVWYAPESSVEDAVKGKQEEQATQAASIPDEAMPADKAQTPKQYGYF